MYISPQWREPVLLSVNMIVGRRYCYHIKGNWGRFLKDQEETLSVLHALFTCYTLCVVDDQDMLGVLYGVYLAVRSASAVYLPRTLCGRRPRHACLVRGVLRCLFCMRCFTCHASCVVDNNDMPALRGVYFTR